MPRLLFLSRPAFSRPQLSQNQSLIKSKIPALRIRCNPFPAASSPKNTKARNLCLDSGADKLNLLVELLSKREARAFPPEPSVPVQPFGTSPLLPWVFSPVGGKGRSQPVVYLLYDGSCNSVKSAASFSLLAWGLRDKGTT